MRAVLVHEFGTIDTPTMGEVPRPAPRADEVLVKVQASAINFVDLLVIEGKYQFLPQRPFVPGKGPAGVVIAKGDAVTDIQIGDRILAMAEYGGWGEMVALPENQCYRLPAQMSFVDAASMSLCYDTAWFALHERARYKSGDVVLILGASGAVGYATLQLAKATGAKVLAGAASAAKADKLRAAGADAIIDLSTDNLLDDLRAQVYRANDGLGADIVIDMIGGDAFDAALRAIAWRGRMVVVGFAAGRIPTIKANYLLLKNIEVSGLQISDYRKRMPERVGQCYTEIFDLFVAGKITAPPSITLPLNEFAKGLEMLQNRTAPGRIILTHES